MTASATQPSDGAAPPLRDAAAEWFHASRQQLAATLSLCTAEVRYSGLMLVSALACALVAALALFSAWGLLLAAGVMWLMAVGLSVAGSLAVVALSNIVLVAASVVLLRSALSRVGLDATREVLRVGNDDAL